jgi:hypothetical protein
VSSADLATVVAEVSGRSDLGWFWDRYLYRAELPRWSMSRDGSMVNLSWDDPAFELPLPVTVGGEPRRVAMPGGRAEIEVGEGVEVVVDPDGRILAQPAE